MSAETESIVLGAIALFAAVGTAVAIRRKTAKAAVACCIVGGGVLLLYGNLDHEAKREAERQAQWRERQERLRASSQRETPDDPSLIVLPNGSVRRPNGLNIGMDRDGRNLGGDSAFRGMRSFPGAVGEGAKQGIPQRRRTPMSGPVPGGSSNSDDQPPPQPDTP